MKKSPVLLAILFLALICSCSKKDSSGPSKTVRWAMYNDTLRSFGSVVHDEKTFKLLPEDWEYTGPDDFNDKTSGWTNTDLNFSGLPPGVKAGDMEIWLLHNDWKKVTYMNGVYKLDSGKVSLYIPKKSMQFEVILIKDGELYTYLSPVMSSVSGSTPVTMTKTTPAAFRAIISLIR